MDNLLIKCRDSLESINKYTDAAKEQVKKLVMDDEGFWQGARLLSESWVVCKSGTGA